MKETDPLYDVKMQLVDAVEAEDRMCLRTNMPIPSIHQINELIEQIKCVLFPDFFLAKAHRIHSRKSQVDNSVEKIFNILRQEIAASMVFCTDCEALDSDKADEIARQFIFQLPKIKHLLLTDIEAVTMRDPAVDNYGEVILSYPGIQVMIHHRTAHELYKLGVPVLPRIIMEVAHSQTGIDIHPAAEIGEYFAIDHGTGIVVGKTTIIGSHCMLYQGVTLGAKNFTFNEKGLPIDDPRHPILEDNVTVYSNSSILGRITIGHHTVIGGNVWIDTDVPPYSVITQAAPLQKRDETDE